MDISSVLVALVTALVFGFVGIYYSRRRSLSVEGYISNRYSAGTFISYATLVASVIGAWVLFSPAETGTWAGIAGLIGYALGQAAPLAVFVSIGPRMRRLMPAGHSLTEYVWFRYGKLMYAFTLAVIVFYMFVFLSAELTGIAKAVHMLSGAPLGLTALIVGVMTVGYTAYGGLRASIFTDRIQFVLILPLLLFSFVVLILEMGGLRSGISLVSQKSPQLVSISHGPGIEFGVVLIIAILSANMFHQGFWQRVYISKNDSVMRRSFSTAGVIVVPIILLTGFLGVLAVGKNLADTPSVALFSVVESVMPPWAILVVLVLALVLVMSSLDTLLNGIASVFTSDLARFKSNWDGTDLLKLSRTITVLLVFPAIFIASRGYSVLYLFLIADLVCSAAVFPVFWGLYSKRFTGRAALFSCVAGLVIGSLFFPKPDFTPWIDIPMAGRFIVSFGTALGFSVLASLVLTVQGEWIGRRDDFDFNQLKTGVRLIKG